MQETHPESEVSFYYKGLIIKELDLQEKESGPDKIEVIKKADSLLSPILNMLEYKSSLDNDGIIKVIRRLQVVMAILRDSIENTNEE